jgi:glycosyltransferase involved in cell wall biosynthesis
LTNVDKIDVVLLTKNSVKPCLKECLESIYAYIPVNRLIVVDGGSTDGTLEVVQEYPNVKVIKDSNGTRATARQKGIKAVETPWHLHVDSDVILCQDWFKKALRWIDESVGALWGVAIPVEPSTWAVTKAMSKFYRMPIRNVLLRPDRYMTHDTLFRTDVLRDIKIPKDLIVWEDDYIGRHIIKKGFKFLKVNDPYCIHYASEKRTDVEILNGYIIHKYKIWSPNRMFQFFILAVPRFAWIFMCTGNFKAAKKHLLNSILITKGWLMYVDAKN